ncbi:SPRY domain-containing protein 3 [Folsomia candida]|uniref:SPRY domain-containing protein 3 n=1 Tax=Folsomia candida TaxID=158441 RepID=UPI000B8F21CE|nr:SPRY domain-containing protein 3 [Folsomia candida]
MAKNAEEASRSGDSHQSFLQEGGQGASSSTSSEETGRGEYLIDDDVLVFANTAVLDGPLSNSTTSSSEVDDHDDHQDQSSTNFQHPSSSSPPLPPGSPSCSSSDVVPMTIDTCEDLWTRLHDIQINGCILEYVGRGKSIYDNGLAQSCTPLTPMNHYYEVTIIHPGESCYIAIGLARKDYPSHKHPGWNRGSIAYHADDGKIFIGSGIGTPFGPKCHSNDVLGCGIVFPSHLHNSRPNLAKDQPEEVTEEESASSEWPWEKNAIAKSSFPRSESPSGGYMDNILEASSESEDDIWWNNKNQVYEDKVQVFFMRNCKLLGMKEIRIPKGGFYPTIGMMSRNEKLMIDMNPLTG